MPGKDDPLNAAGPWEDPRAGVTLLLEPETMGKACKAFFERAHEIDSGIDERTWNTAWMAAVAAFDYMMQGRTRPR